MLLESLKQDLGDKIVSSHDFRGDETIVLAPKDLIEAVKLIRSDKYKLDFLMDLTVVDWLGEALRFEVVYHFFSSKTFKRLRIKVRVPEDNPKVPTLDGQYKSANWMEREAWEFYGVIFDGHPNLKQILLYPEFKGYPLRKDYPKAGEQPRIELIDHRFTSSDMPSGTG